MLIRGENMRNIRVVALREISTLLRRPSFFATLLLAPSIIAVILFGFSFLNRELGDDIAQDPNFALVKPVGYVDQAGIVASIPPPLAQLFVAYDDEAQAAAALRGGTIGSYFVV